MTAAQLATVKQNAHNTGVQLYSDVDRDLAYSWNNSFDNMLKAVALLAGGHRWDAWQTVKQTQSSSVQQHFDLGWSSFGEWTIWLTMLSTAPGIEGWGEVDNIVKSCYNSNLNGLVTANNTWGSNPNGPPELPPTITAFCQLMNAVFTEPGVSEFRKVTAGLLRFGLNDDVVKLFGLVHKYIPVPAEH
jgi:hypothetical protein